jgi:hypothetical protein
VLLLNKCLLLLFTSLLTQSGNFWIHPCISLLHLGIITCQQTVGIQYSRDAETVALPPSLALTEILMTTDKHVYKNCVKMSRRQY